MSRILITGAAGFSGRHLTRYLIKMGTVPLGTYCGSRLDSGLSSKHYIKLDLTQKKAVARVVRNVRPEIVYHLAAQSIPVISWKRPLETYAINTGGTVNLLDALVQCAPSARLVFVSTNQVYGSVFKAGKPVKESQTVIPENPYAYSKLLAEYACRNYFKRFKLDVIIARPFNHIGRGLPAPLIFAQWARQIAQAERLGDLRELITGNLSLVREFLHVDDVVRAYVILAQKGVSGEVYNIASGKRRSLRLYANRLLGLSKVHLKLKEDKRLFRNDDPAVIAGSNHKIKKLGWHPGRDALEALPEILDEWRSKDGAR